MRLFTLTLLAFSTATFADNHTSTQEANGIIDSLNKSVTDTTHQLVDDIESDLLNSKFLVKLTRLDSDYWLDGGFSPIETMPENTLLGTFGLYLLPNTWKIKFTYTLTLGDNIVFPSSAIDDYEDQISSPTANYVYQDSDHDTSLIDIYMKPISTSYGDIGFGYRQINKHTIGIIAPTGTVTLLDISDGAGGALTASGANPDIVAANSRTSRTLLTYDFPVKIFSDTHLGFSYAYETSDQLKILDQSNSVIVNPDRTTHIYSFGIRKTLDQITHGFDVKTLTYGSVDNEYKFYNHTTSQNETILTNGSQFTVELIYMFKANNHRQYYLLAQILRRDESDTNFVNNEVLAELGLRF